MLHQLAHEEVISARQLRQYGGLKREGRTHVIPGFLGTPAGMITISAPLRAPATLEPLLSASSTL